MSTLLLDARAHATALKAAVTAELDEWQAYDYGKVPGSDGNTGVLPNLFALITVDQVPSGSPRMSGQTGTTRWIVSVRGVGRTVDEARWVLFKAAAALHEQVLTVDGRTTEPLQARPGQSPRKDGTRYSGLSVYVYSH